MPLGIQRAAGLFTPIWISDAAFAVGLHEPAAQVTEGSCPCRFDEDTLFCGGMSGEAGLCGGSWMANGLVQPRRYRALINTRIANQHSVDRKLAR